MNLIKINQESKEFKMNGKNVMVKLEELATNAETKTDSGIIVQMATNKSAVTDRNTFGQVQEVGKDCKEVQKGDFVFWHITSGCEVQFRDGYFMIIDEERLLGCSK